MWGLAYCSDHKITERLRLAGNAADHLDHAEHNQLLFAWDHAPADFEYLHGLRFHNLSKQPVPVLHHPHDKKVSWCSEENSCASVCAHYLFYCHQTQLKSDCLFLNCLSLIRSLVSPRLSNPSSLSLSFCAKVSSSLIYSVALSKSSVYFLCDLLAYCVHFCVLYLLHKHFQGPKLVKKLLI